MDGLRLNAGINPITITKSPTNLCHITTFLTSTSYASTNDRKIGSWGCYLKNPEKCNGYDVVAVENTVADDKMAEKNWQKGNWLFKVLQVRSLWKTNENNDGEHDLGNEVSINQECDTCQVDDEDENVKVEFDKASFSKLLWTVSLGDARLYAQMAYLGSLSYTIPKIKLGNLLKRLRLRFITSSLEKKADVALKAHKEKASEEVQQDECTITEKNVLGDDLNSLCSSPCEWYICDDDESSTRYFVIQGSESLASWQANILFEPIQFEASDAIVHRGIYEAAKVVYKEMLPRVHEHLQRHGNRATIRLTGHSLGGSLSLLVNLMLLIRGQVHISCLLPVITFGAPWVMCGGDRLLHNLGLPRNHLQGITMHRDIAINGNFRNHPCLNKNLLYAPMGEFLILQPDAKLSPSHDLLPPGAGLYILRSHSSNADLAKKLTRAAQSLFLNTPHPIEILTDPSAYGSAGAILRDHDVDTYLTAIRSVIRQELNRVRRMKRQQRRQYWWQLVEVNQSQVKLLFDGGTRWSKTMVSSQHMYLLVGMILVPYARLLIIKACNWVNLGLQQYYWSEIVPAKKISKSVFVTNFPKDSTARDLWKVCSDYGTVVDVFFPFKRSKSGKRFAFVRFIKRGSQSHVTPEITKPALILDETCIKEFDFGMSLMGRAKYVSAIHNLPCMIFKEGFQNVKLSYLGGMWVLFEFDYLASKEKFLNHSGIGSWFTELIQATSSFENDERIVWISIEGLSIKAWTPNTFRKIASLWGEYVEWEEADLKFCHVNTCV
nr:alpha/beta hydrolase fold protein [Tanacetum cinerariifolium]